MACPGCHAVGPGSLWKGDHRLDRHVRARLLEGHIRRAHPGRLADRDLLGAHVRPGRLVDRGLLGDHSRQVLR